ncbi:hypothetical protein [Chitinophaga niabensis]|uniref:Uncharacterized protein n=1 Tax=Chitinophaga niabensis TaxID=536979 RepID=A0A1N6JSG4_9BACT|nr:hypothetical protein [Chitinophaga niabensis]SIO47272.1 hypothetical protein SAMN04488055_4344 [Chitinophaga niabensis]
MYRLLIMGCLPFLACSVVKPTIVKAPDLYTTENELAVKIKDGWLSAKTISLGSYNTTSRSNGVADHSPAKQIKQASDAFYFTLKGKDVQVPVQLLSTNAISFSNRTLPSYLNGLPGDAPLWYIHVGATALTPLKTWELILKRNLSFLELNENKPVGVLRSATEEIRVTVHNRFGIRNSYEKTCYEFQLKGIPVAAVIVGDAPKAWIYTKADADLQQTLSAAMAALLFR